MRLVIVSPLHELYKHFWFRIGIKFLDCSQKLKMKIRNR